MDILAQMSDVAPAFELRESVAHSQTQQLDLPVIMGLMIMEFRFRLFVVPPKEKGGEESYVMEQSTGSELLHSLPFKACELEMGKNWILDQIMGLQGEAGTPVC